MIFESRIVIIGRFGRRKIQIYMGYLSHLPFLLESRGGSTRWQCTARKFKIGKPRGPKASEWFYYLPLFIWTLHMSACSSDAVSIVPHTCYHVLQRASACTQTLSSLEGSAPRNKFT